MSRIRYVCDVKQLHVPQICSNRAYYVELAGKIFLLYFNFPYFFCSPVLLRFRRPPGKKEEDGKKSAGQQIQQAKKRKASHDPIDVTHLAKKARRLLHQASSAHSRGSSFVSTL